METRAENGVAYRFIKDVVFDLIQKSNGCVDYHTIADEVKKRFPNSAWKETHWAWYKTQIVRGKYAEHFSDEAKKNLYRKGITAQGIEVPPDEKLFTWLPFFEEMLAVVSKNYDKNDLCRVTHDIFGNAGLEDEFPEGSGPLREIDPLTFIAFFNRNNTDEKRIAYCKQAKEKLGLSSEVPADFEGIGTFMALKVWFFPTAKVRTNEMEILWSFARELNNSSICDDSFTAVRNIKNVEVTKLTQIMAICKPRQYLPLNDKVRIYAKYKGGISPNNFRDYIRKSEKPLEKYREIIESIKNAFADMSLAEISHNAHMYYEWLESTDVKEGKKYWIIAAGGKAEFWNRWQKEGVMTIGWSKIGDFGQYSDKKAIQKAIYEAYEPGVQPVQQAKICYDFKNEVSLGDYVICKKGNSKILGIGIVKGDYNHLSIDDDQRNVREVKWLKMGEWDVPSNDWDKTLTDISGDLLLKAYLRIIGDYSVTAVPPKTETAKSYTIQQAIGDLFISQEMFEKIINLMKHKNNIILQGAPGVGKTFIAKRLAKYLIGQDDSDKLEMIQFHQSYSYEDFIQGYVLHNEQLSRIRGKIDFAASINRNFMKMPKLVCEYDEFDYNILHNQILKSTLMRLIRCDNLDETIKNETCGLYRRLDGIEDIRLVKRHFGMVKLSRNNRFYDFLMKICELIFDNLVPTENDGKFIFQDFRREHNAMAMLFQAFVRNFYKHEQSVYRVESEQIKWDVRGDETDDSMAVLPQMNTDVSLSAENRKIVIDTKFYSKTLIEHYGKEKVISSNLYQIFAYLMNIEQLSGNENKNCEGILLYPVTEKEHSYQWTIKDHRVAIETINLYQPWQNIHSDLLQLISLKGN